MSVALTNATRRMKVLNLPHATYCAALGRCACTPHPLVENATVASSLTLAAGETVTGLPEAVLAAPDVNRAIKAGELRVQEVPAPSPASEPDVPASRKARPDKKDGGAP
jgi:uncharacterized membrane protein YhhN